MPLWALTVAFWLHMVATVVWIGSLSLQAFLLTPATSHSDSPEGPSSQLERFRRRLEPFTWLSLGVLIFSGLSQMVANPNYQGLLSLQNRWSLAIFAKHLVIGLMVAVGLYQRWWLEPNLSRLALLRKRRAVERTDELDALIRRQRALANLNLALGIVVLALTAVARTA